jgi:hypothetical protein
VMTRSASDSPASSASGPGGRLSELSDEFARHVDPSIVQYYGTLADPNIVLPATGDLELDNIPPAKLPLQRDAILQEDINTPSPFFDPTLQVAMMKQAHRPAQNIAGPSTSMSVPRHPYFTEAYQSNTEGEAWRNYVDTLGTMEP